MKLIKLRSLVVLLGLVCVWVTGCGGSLLTAKEIDQNGTKTYPAPKEKLTENISLVLKSMGYEVVVTDPEKGVVTTSRKEIGQSTQTTGTRGRSTSSARSISTGYFRQYLVKVNETKPGSATVRVTPKVFIGERDVSEEKVWNIEGAGGERELWRSFFRELEAMN